MQPLAQRWSEGDPSPSVQGDPDRRTGAVPRPAVDHRISYVRAVACLLVILQHVAAGDFAIFDSRWRAANVYDSISRVCVPLFFMIAGATLLHRQEPLRQFLLKRVLRIVPPLLFWSLFYWVRSGTRGNPIVAILEGPVAPHLWYFYAVLGLYLGVPALRHFYRHATNAELLFYLSLWFGVGSVYWCYRRLVPGPYYDVIYGVTYTLNYLGYFLLGACLYHKKFRRFCSPEARWMLGCCLAAAGIGLTAGLTSTYCVYVTGQPSDLFYEYMAPNVVLGAAGAFLALLHFRDVWGSKFDRLLLPVADASLGIYGLHLLTLERIGTILGVHSRMGSPWVGPLVAAFTAALITLLVVHAARKVTFLKYIA